MAKAVQEPGDSHHADTVQTHALAPVGVAMLFDALDALELVDALAEEMARRGRLIGCEADDRLRIIIREELQSAKDIRRTPSAGFMTVEQAATHAGVTPATIREWIRRSKLVAARAGRRWRILPADLEACLKRATMQEKVDIDREAARLVSLDRARRRR